MIIRLRPLPDELDLGYMGRLIQMNGARSDKDFISLLSRWCESEGGLEGRVSLAAMMSTVAGVTIQEFVMRHSTAPLRRAITSYRTNLPHGSLDSQYLLSGRGVRPFRPGAYFCQQCVSADQAFHGFSYWRREHQLPGVFWCAKHQSNLHIVEVEDAFSRAPAVFMASATQVSGHWVEEAKVNSYVQRAFDIYSGLIDRPTPLPVTRVSKLLKQRAAAFGLQSSQYQRSSKPLLSDRVVDRFGREWLATVMPALASKKSGELLHQLDGVLYLANSASSVVAYVLAAAVLFDSADEALNELVMSESTKFPKRAINRLPDDQVIRNAYQMAKGRYGEAARLLGCGSAGLALRLKNMGLPNFGSRHGDGLLRSMRAFLQGGISIADSAHIGEIPLELFETCLRTVASSFGHLFQDEASVVEESKSRAVPMTPNEVNSLLVAEI